MRMGMVLAEGSLPTDVRVTREARALLAGAHRIFILCRQNPGQPLEESWRGIEIERAKTLRQPFAATQKLLFYLLLRDLRWEAHLHDFAYRQARPRKGLVWSVQAVIMVNLVYWGGVLPASLTP
jgi:hypothetical protein